MKRIIFTGYKTNSIFKKFVAMSLDVNIKEKLLTRCIALKEESESNILTAMNDAQTSANEYGPPKDRYDSFRAQLMRKRDMLAHQLAVVEEELRYLRQVKPGIAFSKVEAGALVRLNTQTLYIIAGIGKIEMDGETYYIVSPVVPLITAMKNLKAGDSFSFRGTNMKILDIC